MKEHRNIFSILFIALFFCTACKKEFLNPYDPATSPDAWAPKNLQVEILNRNAAILTWEQEEMHIDGFEVVKTIDGVSHISTIDKNAREYSDQHVLENDMLSNCREVSFSIRALAGENTSNSIALSNSLLFPHTSTADAGPDQLISGIGETTITLSASAPGEGESGTWSIISGSNGYIAEINNPNTTLSAAAGTDYTMVWTISGVCGDSQDELIIETVEIGDQTSDGIVAHIFQPGDPGYVAGEVHGLLVSDYDIGTAAWGCSGSSMGTSEGLGSGANNTTSIINACPDNGTAAKLCFNSVNGGFTDWYLPSKDELQLIYDNLAQDGDAGFGNSTYWSSSEDGPYNAHSLHFGTGSSGFSGKHSHLRIRSVRTF